MPGKYVTGFQARAIVSVRGAIVAGLTAIWVASASTRSLLAASTLFPVVAILGTKVTVGEGISFVRNGVLGSIFGAIFAIVLAAIINPKSTLATALGILIVIFIITYAIDPTKRKLALLIFTISALSNFLSSGEIDKYILPLQVLANVMMGIGSGFIGTLVLWPFFAQTQFERRLKSVTSHIFTMNAILLTNFVKRFSRWNELVERRRAASPASESGPGHISRIEALLREAGIKADPQLTVRSTRSTRSTRSGRGRTSPAMFSASTGDQNTAPMHQDEGVDGRGRRTTISDTGTATTTTTTATPPTVRSKSPPTSQAVWSNFFSIDKSKFPAYYNFSDTILETSLARSDMTDVRERAEKSVGFLGVAFGEAVWEHKVFGLFFKSTVARNQRWMIVARKLLLLVDFMANAESRFSDSPALSEFAERMGFPLAKLLIELHNVVQLGQKHVERPLQREALLAAKEALMNEFDAMLLTYVHTRRVIWFTDGGLGAQLSPFTEVQGSKDVDKKFLPQELFKSVRDVEAVNAFLWGFVRSTYRVRDALNEEIDALTPKPRVPRHTSHCRRLVRTFTHSCKAAFAGAVAYVKNWKIDVPAAKTATQVSVAITIASLFTLLKDVPDSFGGTNASWAATTVAFVADASLGALFRQSILRFQGIVAGSIFGFLAYDWADKRYWILPFLLALWNLFASYVKTSPGYEYAGYVACYTAAIIMFDPIFDPETSRNSQLTAMASIGTTSYGVAILVATTYIIFPQSSISMTRHLLTDIFEKAHDICVQNLQSHVNAVLSQPSRDANMNQSQVRVVTKELNKNQSSLSVRLGEMESMLARLPGLIRESTFEPAITQRFNAPLVRSIMEDLRLVLMYSRGVWQTVHWVEMLHEDNAFELSLKANAVVEVSSNSTAPRTSLFGELAKNRAWLSNVHQIQFLLPSVLQLLHDIIAHKVRRGQKHKLDIPMEDKFTALRETVMELQKARTSFRVDYHTFVAQTLNDIAHHSVVMRIDNCDALSLNTTIHCIEQLCRTTIKLARTVHRLILSENRTYINLENLLMDMHNLTKDTAQIHVSVV